MAIRGPYIIVMSLVYANTGMYSTFRPDAALGASCELL
jgi:hypothetical protein